MPVDSVTTLKTARSKKPGEVICTGTVTANRPVKGASVELIWDNSHTNLTTTNVNGQFSALIGLPAGRHTVIARFSGEGYPINKSQSTVQTIVIPNSYVDTLSGLLPYIGVACLFCLFIGGAVYYLRRMPIRFRRSPSEAIQAAVPESPLDTNDSQGEENVPGVVETPPTGASDSAEISLFQRYAGLLHAAGLSEAAREVYCNLAERIAEDLQISRFRSRSPREMAKSCRERPYCAAFSRLVATYERIRYAGETSVPVREEFEHSMHAADSQFGGEDH
jgi:hypothetical protein